MEVTTDIGEIPMNILQIDINNLTYDERLALSRAARYSDNEELLVLGILAKKGFHCDKMFSFDRNLSDGAKNTFVCRLYEKTTVVEEVETEEVQVCLAEAQRDRCFRGSCSCPKEVRPKTK